MAEVVIIGMADLQRKLKQLELAVQRQVLIEAAQAGAQIVLDDARSRVPVDSGNLRRNIRKRLAGRQSDIHEATVDVYIAKGGFYGRFLEFGTKFIKAIPFFVPAVKNNLERIKLTMNTTLKRAVERAA